MHLHINNNLSFFLWLSLFLSINVYIYIHLHRVIMQQCRDTQREYIHVSSLCNHVGIQNEIVYLFIHLCIMQPCRYTQREYISFFSVQPSRYTQRICLLYIYIYIYTYIYIYIYIQIYKRTILLSGLQIVIRTLHSCPFPPEQNGRVDSFPPPHTHTPTHPPKTNIQNISKKHIGFDSPPPYWRRFDWKVFNSLPPPPPSPPGSFHRGLDPRSPRCPSGFGYKTTSNISLDTI